MFNLKEPIISSSCSVKLPVVRLLTELNVSNTSVLSIFFEFFDRSFNFCQVSASSNSNIVFCLNADHSGARSKA
jgi:hypothetical protein